VIQSLFLNIKGTRIDNKCCKPKIIIMCLYSCPSDLLSFSHCIYEKTDKIVCVVFMSKQVLHRRPSEYRCHKIQKKKDILFTHPFVSSDPKLFMLTSAGFCLILI
jgi:hypothetical protein